MNLEFFEKGISSIADFFGSQYKPEAVRMISATVLVEPEAALKNTYRRCVTEFNTLPAIAKVRDIIIQEGRKIREQESTEREREAQRQKASEPKSPPQGHDEYSRACCEFLQQMFSGRYTLAEKRKLAEEGEKRFPGKGFSYWLKGSLSKGKILPLDRMQMAAGDGYELRELCQ